MSFPLSLKPQKSANRHEVYDTTTLDDMIGGHLLSCGYAVVGLHVETVVFAGGVV